jgi:hypothetical protein
MTFLLFVLGVIHSYFTSIAILQRGNGSIRELASGDQCMFLVHFFNLTRKWINKCSTVTKFGSAIFLTSWRLIFLNYKMHFCLWHAYYNVVS